MATPDLPKRREVWARKRDGKAAVVRQCYPAKPRGHTVIFTCDGLTMAEGLFSFRARYKRMPSIASVEIEGKD
jgi:hypothetical protein